MSASTETAAGASLTSAVMRDDTVGFQNAFLKMRSPTSEAIPTFGRDTRIE
jgi:hypothetical protein